jgi:hypothetical protein
MECGNFFFHGIHKKKHKEKHVNIVYIYIYIYNSRILLMNLEPY